MDITFSDAISNSVDNNRLILETKPVIELDPICLPNNAYGEVLINITLPKQTHVTPGAKHKWSYVREEENIAGMISMHSILCLLLSVYITHLGFPLSEGTSKISFGRLKGKLEQSFEPITNYQIQSTAAASNFTIKVRHNVLLRKLNIIVQSLLISYIFGNVHIYSLMLLLITAMI